mmetsp:Transcript_13467/g.29292  ORF Transcript_13467/g.29292 Transcript_13467/m.29292 type:complete len:206 (+) Transcript_13467:443-1060(+)
MTILPWLSNCMSSPSSSSLKSRSFISISAKCTLLAILEESSISRISPSCSALIRGPPPSFALLPVIAVLAPVMALFPLLMLLSMADRFVVFPVIDVILVNPVTPVMNVLPSSESSSSDSIMSSNPACTERPSCVPAAFLRAARSDNLRIWLIKRVSFSGTKGAIASNPYTRTSFFKIILILDRNRSLPLLYFISPPTTSGSNGSS